MKFYARITNGELVMYKGRLYTAIWTRKNLAEPSAFLRSLGESAAEVKITIVKPVKKAAAPKRKTKK